MTTKDDVKGYLVECDGRSLFIRERDQIGWAIDDSNYEVIALVPAKTYAEVILSPEPTEQAERLKLMEEIYEVQEDQIKLLKDQLTDFVEAVESIHEFSSKASANSLENKGLLLLIAETCGNLLKARE